MPPASQSVRWIAEQCETSLLVIQENSGGLLAATWNSQMSSIFQSSRRQKGENLFPESLDCAPGEISPRIEGSLIGSFG